MFVEGFTSDFLLLGYFYSVASAVKCAARCLDTDGQLRWHSALGTRHWPLLAAQAVWVRCPLIEKTRVSMLVDDNQRDSKLYDQEFPSPSERTAHFNVCACFAS